MARLFTFGCSFTRYAWPTWADIVGTTFPTSFQNWGLTGAGNAYMFHSLMECDARNKLTKDDTIIIMLSSFFREDRYIKGHWEMRGSIYSQQFYSPTFLRRYWDDKGSCLINVSFIKGMIEWLEAKGCQYLITSINPLLNLDQYTTNEFYDEYIEEMFNVFNTQLVSNMHDYLYPNQKEFNWPAVTKFEDQHPSPIQHLNFTRDVICPKLEIILPNRIDEYIDKWMYYIENNDLGKNECYKLKDIKYGRHFTRF